MCGIAGFVDARRSSNADEMKADSSRMTERLHHRGPDACGTWVDPQAGVALGHRRLSILDLSPAGAQPMHSASGRYVSAFNGEIYNFASLRRELEGLGHSFRGHSDTEVMLAAFEQWRPKEAIRRFDGMFAIAVWDRSERQLWLARDRIGEKPLYYGRFGNTFLFASELKAFHAHNDFVPELDRNSLALYLRYRYVPAPHSIYVGVRKLTPGCLLRVRTDSPLEISPEPYWSAAECALKGMEHPFSGSPQDALDEFDQILRTVIRQQMVADVPLGAFLSGGVDSTLVTALMQAQSNRPVRTFTIGFHEKSHNEAEFAKAVASHIGTDHTELYVTPEETKAIIPRLPTIFDEPFADSSQIPTYALAQLTRQHVTVSLSGDGGDELFGGYRHYRTALSRWNAVAWLGPAGRKLLARALPKQPNSVLESLAATMLGAERSNNGWLTDRLNAWRYYLLSSDADEFYLQIFGVWRDPVSLVPGTSPRLRSHSLLQQVPAQLNPTISRYMLQDLLHYLPDDIMVKVDRSTMAVGLESRAPFLDRRIVEFAWSLPLHFKVNKGISKWLPQELLWHYVPRALVDRPKTGFGVPIGEWLRGPVRQWAEELLSTERIKRDGIFQPEPIQHVWHQHVSGTHNWEARLWTILMFQSWHDMFGHVSGQEELHEFRPLVGS